MAVRRRWAIVGATAILSLFTVQPAAADGAAAFAARKARFKQLGADFKTLNEAVRSKGWTPASLSPVVRRVRSAAHDLPRWFPAGSGPESAPKTRAKAAAWSDVAAFRAAASAFAAETNQLDLMVRNGITNEIPAQVRAVGQTCAACHAKFRQKD